MELVAAFGNSFIYGTLVYCSNQLYQNDIFQACQTSVEQPLA